LIGANGELVTPDVVSNGGCSMAPQYTYVYQGGTMTGNRKVEAHRNG
jgi:hypothetical protein